MASTSSDIAALKAENARLRAENTDLFHQMDSWRRDAHELELRVSELQDRIRALLGRIPAGALPAPTVFGDPRSVPGADHDGDGAAAAAGGGHPSPPAARSVSVPALGPSGAGVCEYDDTIPANTDDKTKTVMLCASPNCNSGLTIEYAGPGLARWVPMVKKPEDENNE